NQSNKQCRETTFGWFFCICILLNGGKVAMVWRYAEIMIVHVCLNSKGEAKLSCNSSAFRILN
ncbi:hypothetical protein, partial [Escherichia coli]|uniref:hypothetical protein n=1 Tax=Escherichia coli TaxID=562 RepID=UPI001BC85D26